ncbi:MAG: nonstructural protein [Microviridae sp.]|nr:MAG: nonstructural protein [Microviridae sp.]
MILVSIRDLKADAFFKPFTSANADTAVRELNALVAKGDSPLSEYPDDYQAIVVGSFDEKTGVVSGLDPVVLTIIRPLRVI